MKYEKEFARSLFKNAVIFLDSAIKYFNEGLDYHVNMVQSIVNLQFALELALKSSVTSQYGIRTILINKQKELKDSELEELYLANKLKVREYDDIKNYIKGKGYLFGFNRKEYKYMENAVWATRILEDNEAVVDGGIGEVNATTDMYGTCLGNFNECRNYRR